MRLLVTNDDGIDAPGLAALERIAQNFSDDVWVVAPASEQSGAARSLTLSNPLRIARYGERKFSVSGTPADCVILAVNDLIQGPAPALLLSGVNRGQNIAEDVTYSGTIAGAMEGAHLGIPSIALSQALDPERNFAAHWQTAETHAPPVLRRLIEAGWPKGVLLNVNFPPVPPDQVAGVEVTTQGRRPHSLFRVEPRTDPRGRNYYWLGYNRVLSTPPPGCDLHALRAARVSVTPLHLDLTHQPARRTLAARLNPAPRPRAKRTG